MDMKPEAYFTEQKPVSGEEPMGKQNNQQNIGETSCHVMAMKYNLNKEECSSLNIPKTGVTVRWDTLPTSNGRGIHY